MRYLRLFLLALATLAVPEVVAEPDDLEARALAGRWALRWDDPEERLNWSDRSQEPRRAGDVLRLRRGDEVEVQVPARAHLRLLSAGEGPLRAEKLSMWIGNGTGLALELEPTEAGEELHLHSPLDVPALVRLRREREPDTQTLARARGAEDALALRLFVSREVVPPSAVRYGELIALPGETRRVDASRTGAAEPFVPLPARAPAAIELEGPRRLVLISRLDESAGDAGWDGEHRIQVRLDGEPLRSIEHLSVPDFRRPVRVDGLPRVLGTPERGFIELPEGRHRLSLESNANLLLQLAARERPEYLFPELNRPRSLDEETAPLRTPFCRPPWAANQRSLTPSGNWCRALGLARDNRHRPGGLAAAELLRTQAATRPELPDLYQDAMEVRGRYSFYRDLWPEQAATAIRRAAFPTPRLLVPGEARLLRLDSAQGRSLADRLAQGAFVALTGVARDYRLPERDADGSLRLAVSGRGGLWLQLDGKTPRRLEVRPPQPDYRFQLDPAWESQGPNGASLSAPRRRPAPLVAAAAIELPLPRAVKGFRIWSAAGADLWVAAAYRAAAPYEMPERGYLDLLDRVGSQRAMDALFAALEQGRDRAADPDIAELRNTWLPWIRALDARLRRFTANLMTGEPVPAATPLDDEDRQRLRRRAAAAKGDAAVEAWAKLAQHSRGAVRAEALLRLAAALDAAGESYLADRLRRNLVLRDVPGAATALAERYRLTEDAEALETLGAVQFRRRPGLETLLALVTRLAEQGRSRDVLELGLLLVRRDRIPEGLRAHLLEAALDQGWDRTFSRLVRDLPETQRRRWRGHQAAARGDWQDAVAHYQAAGAGTELQSLRRALEVRTGLADDRAEVREAALADWSAQQWAGAGRARWRPALWLATAGGGVELADAELARAQTRLLARPAAPVRLRVTGPARLRLDVRLLHELQGEAPREQLEDWLLIHQGGRVRRIPLPASRPVPGLERIGGGARPGTRFERILDLPAGEHAIAVSAAAAPMVVGLELEQPLIPWLGPRTPAAAALVRAGDWGRDPSARAADTDALRPLTRLAESGMQRLPARPLPRPSNAWTDLSADDLAGAPPPAEADRSIAQVSAWLWQREQTGTLSSEVLAAASRLLAAHPDDARLKKLGRRLLRGTSWERLEQLEQGAGLRFRELSAWRPDNPVLRGRLALLAAPLPGESFLIGGARVVLDIFNPAPATLRLELGLDGPGFLPLEDAGVEVIIDGVPVHRILLSALRPRRTLDLRLDAGEHQIRVAGTDPVVHQLVRVRALEPRGDTLVPVSGDLRRAYQIATRAQPLVAHVEGPAWLRLDEWRDGESLSSYQAIGPGWQELVLAPEEGREERLLRLFLLAPPVPGEEPEPSAPRPMPVAGLPLSAPPLEPGAGAAPFAPNAGPDVSDLPVGGQEDGTWSPRLALVRSAGIEGDEEQGIPDDYLELGATYREYLPDWRAWWRGELLNRWREDGRPTLGLRGRFFRQPERLPFDYDLRGAWYGQWLPDGLAWSANASLSLSRRMELDLKSYHRARLTLFGRHLNSDRPPEKTKVDQDVYSAYKRDHRYGLRYAHTLYRSPWRDNQWRIGARLATNERLYSLDNATLRAGYRQRLGGFGLDGELRWTHYFADDDRSSSLDRRKLVIGISWEGWRRNGNRLELGLRWLKDLDLGDNNVLLALSWHASRGRDFRDFAPEDIEFRDLRTWRLWDLDHDR